jgi:hypothetical protein
MLLPGFMFLGLLAPAAVTVKPKAEEQTSSPVSFRDFTPRRTIYVPRGIEITQGVADIAVEPLFSGARQLARDRRERSEVDLPAVAAAAETREVITLAKEDGAGDYVSDALFDQSEDNPALAVDFTPLWDPARFDIIPSSLASSGNTQWDDFHGNGVQLPRHPPRAVLVPEPATGVLLALGLVAMALRGRKR